VAGGGPGRPRGSSIGRGYPLKTLALSFFLAVSLPLVAIACSSTQPSSSPKTGGACTTNADCPSGTACGYANADGSYGDCSAKGVCVIPISPQPTQMCGCNGQPITLVVDDVDSGTYYWSGVLAGEVGFPPCSDAAVIAWPDSGAPSDAGDASAPPIDAPSGDASLEAGGDATPDAALDAPSDGSSD